VKGSKEGMSEEIMKPLSQTPMTRGAPFLAQIILSGSSEKKEAIAHVPSIFDIALSKAVSKSTLPVLISSSIR